MKKRTTPASATSLPGDVASSLRAVFTPPGGLLSRVRWVFLLLSLLMALLQPLPFLARAEGVPWGLRAAVFGGLLVLAAVFVDAYVRGRSRAASLPLEVLAVFGYVVVLPNPLYGLGLVYPSLMFRSLHATTRALPLVWLGYVGALLAGLVFSRGEAAEGVFSPVLLGELLGLTFISVTLHVLAQITARSERVLSRETTLREVGARLVAAGSREEVYDAVLEGAQRLTRDVPATRSSVAVGPVERMAVVASVGDAAEEVRGARFSVLDYPENIREPLLRRSSVAASHTDIAAMREALGFEPKVNSSYFVPLLIDDEINGLLVVASDGTLHGDVRDALDILGAQAVLALESVAGAEEALRRRSEERFKALIQNASDLVTVVDAEGTIVYESPSVEGMLGHRPEDVVGTHMLGLLHPEDAEKAQSVFAEALGRPGVTSAVEVRVRHKDGSWRHIEAVGNNLLHDPVVRGIVVNSRDITERKRTEEALRESEELHRSVVEQASEGIFIFDPRTKRILEANLAFRRMFGYDREEIARIKLYDLIPHDPEGVDRNVERALEQRHLLVGERDYRRKDGSAIDVEVSGSVILYGGREVICSVVRDITERKRAEEALREREASLATAQRLARLGSWDTGPLVGDPFDPGREISWSDELFRILGHAPRSFTPTLRDLVEAIHPEDRGRVGEAMHEAATLQERFMELDHRMVRPDGEVRDVRVRLETAYAECSEPFRQFGTMLDVTESKRAEEALRRSERELAAAQRIAHVGNWTFEVGEDEARWSDEMYRIFGLAPGAFPVSYRTFMRFVHPEDKGRVRRAVRAALFGGDDRLGLDYRIVRADGEVRHVHAQYEIERDASGLAVRLIGTAHDVTERERAEEALKASEARYRALVEQTPAVTYIEAIDEGPLAHDIRYVSPQIEGLLGYSQEEWTTDPSLFERLLHPEDREWVLAEDERTERTGEPFRVEYRNLTKDGRVVWLRDEAVLVRDEAGRALYWQGVMYDVTEAKRAEEELDRLAQIVESSDDAIYSGDLGGTVTTWNRGAERLYGYSAEEMIGRPVAVLTPPGIAHEVPAILERISRGESVDHRETVRVARDGRHIDVSITVSPTRDATGAVVGASAIARDITERKRAEEALKESEARYRTLVEQLPAVTYVQEIENNTLAYVSPQLEDVLGYAPEEYLADPALRFATIHPDDRAWVLEEDRITDLTGEPYRVEHRRLTRDGRTVWVRDEAVLVRDEGGRPLFWQGVMIDITDSKLAGEALRQSEERYRAVVEQAVEGIYVVDAESRRIVESNEAFARLLGYTGEELSGLTLYDIVAHDRESVDARLRRVMEKGSLAIGERKHRRKDGVLVDVEVSASVIPLGGRDVISCVAHDVTERRRAERALRESEELFRAVFENAATGIALTDRDGRFVRVNAALEGILGYGAEELREKTFAELTHPEDVGANLSLLEGMLRDEVEGYDMEKRYVRKDGSVVWAHLTVSCIGEADGGPGYVLGLVEDITERKRAEEEIRRLNEDLERRVVERTAQLEATVADLREAQVALRSSEERTRAIVETAPDAIVTTGDDGLIRSFNPGAERTFGYRAGEVLGEPLALLMPEHFRDWHVMGFRRHLETDEARIVGKDPVELVGRRKDGTEFPLELALGEVRDGGDVLFTGIIRDITERKRAEEELAYHARLFENIRDAVIATDERFVLTAWNKGAEEMFGRTADEALGRDIHEVVGAEYGDGQMVESLRELTERGRWRGEMVMRRADGTPFHTEALTIALRGDGGEVSGYLNITRDITERKRAEAAMRAYAERLRESNRELQDFAYVASHDLQEPLRKVRAFGDRLRTKHGETLGEQGRDYLERMSGAAARMQDLIEDLLELSRVTTQARPFEAVDLGEVSREVVSDLAARLEETGGTVEVGELPTVEADRAQMRQLLQNLLGNALKFHRPGEPPLVRVHGEVSDNGPAGAGVCRVVVEDDGIGFEEEHAARIFAPFERLHGRGAYEGTGMGLAICRRVAERHGGKVTARSEPGRGSTFVVTLPTEQPEGAGRRGPGDADG